MKQEMDFNLSKAKIIVSSNPVVVFSKPWLGYCKKVQKLFKQLKISYRLIELDDKNDGDEMQSALKAWTGQSTLPYVFIGGNLIGDSDAVMEVLLSGKLMPLLIEAGTTSAGND